MAHHALVSPLLRTDVDPLCMLWVWVWVFPQVIIHSCVILFLNQFLYRRIAVRLTHWENHRTESDHENALIIKRFLVRATALMGLVSCEHLGDHEEGLMKSICTKSMNTEANTEAHICTPLRTPIAL